MKILAVCGFGVGSSMVLKMTLEKACRMLNIEAEVENSDVTMARGEVCDVIFTSYELAETLGNSVSVPVVPIKRYMNLEEVKNGLMKFVKGGE